MGILDRKNITPEPAAVPMKARPYKALRPIVASAERVDLRDSKEVDAIDQRQKADKWQEEAWTYYDLIGEIHYCANLIADVLSRVNIYVGYNTNSSLTPSAVESLEKDTIDEGLKAEAVNILQLLETGVGGTSGLMRNMGLNMFVAGECFLIKEPQTFTKPERWQARSVQEIVATSADRHSPISVKTRRDMKKEQYRRISREDGYLVRLWRNHPQYSDEADSSLRAILDLCEQLLLLARQERVFSRSALNNGILYIPDDVSNLFQNDAEMTDEDDDVETNNGPDLEEELMRIITDAIQNENSGSTVAPLILRGPLDAVEGIKHITFQRPQDKSTTEKMSTILDRILAGLSIPKDIAAGMSNVKYSNAILIEESLYSSHIEPLILLICDQLTTAFLRPILLNYGYTEDQIKNLVVWYDPSAITAKPSKSEAATQGYQNGILSAEAWRRANGFAESDKPSELEEAKRMALEKGLVSEPVMERVLSLAFASIFNGMRDEQLGANDPTATSALEQTLEPSEGGEPEAPTPTGPDEEIDMSEATSDVQPPEGLVE